MRYVGIASASGSYFQASKNSAVAEFAAVADRRPMFKLMPLVRIANVAAVGVYGANIAGRGTRNPRVRDRRCGHG